MPKHKETEALEALENAATLYERYVELALLAQVSALEGNSDTLVAADEWRSDQPLNITIVTSR